jgi:Mn2+/Fe2+ NRAMP family transporter
VSRSKIGLLVGVAGGAWLPGLGFSIDAAGLAARAPAPLAGEAAATLFGLGFLGAALLAAAIVPLSTSYSISETLGRRADLDDSFSEARTFYLSYGAVVAVAAILVLIPGAPLIPILFLSQALNAVLLLVLLPFLRSLGRDRDLMGEYALAGADRWVTGIAFGLIAASVLALGILAVV